MKTKIYKFYTRVVVIWENIGTDYYDDYV
jgi:hypothetical protein